VIRIVEKVEGGVVVVDSETDVDVLPEIDVDGKAGIDVGVDVEPPVKQSRCPDNRHRFDKNSRMGSIHRRRTTVCLPIESF